MENNIIEAFENKNELSDYAKELYLLKLEDNDKKEILNNSELIKKYKLSAYIISVVLCSINDDRYKEDFLKNNDWLEKYKTDIIKSLSDDRKIDIILNNLFEISNIDIKYILVSLQIENLCSFINNNKTFLEKNNITLFKIFEIMNFQKLLEGIYLIENFNIPENEKRK